MARGRFRQYIYIDPDADFAVVRLSPWAEFVNSERSIEARSTFEPLRRHCS